MDGDIHNWYERLVLEQLSRNIALNSEFSEGLMSDIACIALNHLPSKYVRHSVDMSFYTSPAERIEMDACINAAISAAIEFVRKHPVKT
jgi:hypothetical protein